MSRHSPGVGDVVALADRAEFRHGQLDRQFGETLVAEQEVGKRGRDRHRRAVQRPGRPAVELESTARELVADLVVVVDADVGADLERMPALDPRHVVDELEHFVPDGVRPLGAVTKAAQPVDADARNPPGFGGNRRHARDGQLRGDVTHERQLAAERVEERVEAEPELVDDRRRERAGVAEHRLVDLVVQLRAVQLQRRVDFVVAAVAVPAHQGRR